jgi:AhpD family alkylhydroperoxidase
MTTPPRANTTPGPLIPPLPADRLRALTGPDGDSAVQRLTHVAQPPSAEPVLNVLATIGNHADLLTDLLPLLTRLAHGLLPARDREIAILRVAQLTRAPYTWAHHTRIGVAAGLTDEEVARVRTGPQHPDWNDHDRALQQAADELHTACAISPATWQRLTTRLDDQQMLELLSVIGTYTMASYIINSCRIALEDWIPDPNPLD